jgi:hypothetical protein
MFAITNGETGSLAGANGLRAMSLALNLNRRKKQNAKKH